MRKQVEPFKPQSRVSFYQMIGIKKKARRSCSHTISESEKKMKQRIQYSPKIKLSACLLSSIQLVESDSACKGKDKNKHPRQQ